MGMVVRSNIMAVNANRQLGMNNSQVSKSLEKLASGFKINRAGDDASGLAISEKMKAQIKGLDTASANSQDGISLIQTAEGAMTEVHDMLNRMVELAGKSANGTMDTTVDRASLQKEFNSLLDEIDRVSQGTNFNGIKLLDGSLGGGASAGGTANVTGAPAAMETATAGDGFGGMATAGIDLSALKVDADTNLKITVGAKEYDVAVTKDMTSKQMADAFATAYNADKITGAKGGAYTAVADANGKVTFTATNDVAITTAEVDAVFSGVTVESVAAGAAAKSSTFTPTADDTLTDMGIGSIDLSKAGDVSGKVSIAYDQANSKDLTVTIGDKTFTASNWTANDETVTLTDADGNTIGLEVTDNTISFGADLAETEVGSAKAGTSGLLLQIGDTAEGFNQVTVNIGDMSSTGLALDTLRVANPATATAGGIMSQTDAQNALNLLRGDLNAANTTGIRGAINVVSDARADLGALQNRLEHTINNLDVSSENMNAANSRVRDTDMAKQMMEYTKQNVLTQAAQAMLAQANQQPQSVLQLLQ